MLRAVVFPVARETFSRFRPQISIRRAGLMAPKPLVAVCQVTSTPDKERNWASCAHLVREASGRGACAAFLPEAFDFVGKSLEETLSLAEPLGGEYVQRYASLARGYVGSEASGVCVWTEWVDPEDPTVIAETELLGAAASIEAAAKKLEQLKPRAKPKSKTPGGRGAMRSYNSLILSLFPQPLLRARAIETQCYVIAAAQTGAHHDRRASYGHSMVVDPWGSVVAQCHDGPGLCYAEIDLEYLNRVRKEMPVFRHRRSDLYGRVALRRGSPSP
nr:deaminated glutathione amidase [Anolis sagrei ordinatus]